MWMIRSPRGGYVKELIEQGVIGLGWGDAAARLHAAATPHDFYATGRQSCPQLRHLQMGSAGRQLYKFFREMKLGDPVMTYEFDPAHLSHRDHHRRRADRSECGGARRACPAGRMAPHGATRAAVQGPRASLRSRLPLFQPRAKRCSEIERLIDRRVRPGAAQRAGDAPQTGRMLGPSVRSLTTSPPRSRARAR